jgi:hypothetical protein
MLPPAVGDTTVDVEAEGRVRDGVGDGDGVVSREVASREVAAVPR